MRILMIDDDRTYSEPLQWQLNLDHYEVDYHQSVKTVVTKNGVCLVSRPDCMIVDIMLPSGDIYTSEQTHSGKDTGLLLIRDLRKTFPDVPVVVVTVRDDISPQVLQADWDIANSWVVVKPVTPSEVARLLAKVLAGEADA
jgi:DNA-binding response OmpR family regulator